jgi:hypothetical protein
MAKQLQASLSGGEISPSLYGRTDLAKFAIALGACRNFFVRPTGGASNRAGLEFVYALDPDSLATLIPFVFSTDQSYMLVFQEGTIKVYSQGAYVQNTTPVNITNVTNVSPFLRFTTAVPHGLTFGDPITIASVTGTLDFALLNGDFTVWSVVDPNNFMVERFDLDPIVGAYTGGGTVTVPIALTNPYLSEDLASLRYTQSADVVTIVNQLSRPYEFVRLSATSFTFAAITDFEGGPYLDDNTTVTTVTSSAASGSGVTLTASTPIFTADLIGSTIKISMDDLTLALLKPWEPNKFIAVAGVDPDTLPEMRISNGKAYFASGNAVAPAAGTYTGTVAPSHSEGIRADGDLGLYNGLANTRAGVYWSYQHSLFGTARITAVGGGGLTATADILDYMPIVTPNVTTKWALSAWSENQGYPALVTYFSDRLVFANTPGAPQTEWASKVGDYHNFEVSSPQVANDAIRQRLNARQINAITELVPMDQLIALTSSSSWASPKRGETWSPTTIGFDPQSFDGAAFLRAIQTGDSVLFVQNGSTKVRDLKFKNEAGKFVGDELTVMARHLFDSEHVIVDADYAKEPHGILWLVRSDGALIGLTYLPEQEVIGWHRHDTDGFFERVCVIPEDGVDTPYFVVRRVVNGATVRYLERMAVRDRTDILDSFFVDSGLTYDGRNATGTTITISGASFAGGATVTLTASAPIFAASDVASDAIQFPNAGGNVRANISGFTSSTIVSAVLQSPVPAALQGVPTTTWTFARDTFMRPFAPRGQDGRDPCRRVARGAAGRHRRNHHAPVSGGRGAHRPSLRERHRDAQREPLQQSPVSISDSSQVIPKVSVLVEKTLGLKAGTRRGQPIRLRPTAD